MIFHLPRLYTWTQTEGHLLALQGTWLSIDGSRCIWTAFRGLGDLFISHEDIILETTLPAEHCWEEIDPVDVVKL